MKKLKIDILKDGFGLFGEVNNTRYLLATANSLKSIWDYAKHLQRINNIPVIYLVKMGLTSQENPDARTLPF